MVKQVSPDNVRVKLLLEKPIQSNWEPFFKTKFSPNSELCSKWQLLILAVTMLYGTATYLYLEKDHQF